MKFTWFYVGCNLNEMPKNILENSSKYNTEELKELLKNIPIKQGVIKAADEESLVRLLFTNNIYPIKIKKASGLELRIHKLKRMHHLVQKRNLK